MSLLDYVVLKLSILFPASLLPLGCANRAIFRSADVKKLRGGIFVVNETRDASHFEIEKHRFPKIL